MLDTLLDKETAKEIVGWIFNAMATIIATGSLLFVRRAVKAIDDLKLETAQINKELAQFKLETVQAGFQHTKSLADFRLHVSENFPDKPDIQRSIERVHDQMEALGVSVNRKVEIMSESVERQMGVVQADIKQILHSRHA